MKKIYFLLVSMFIALTSVAQESVSYTIIAGDRNDDSGEGLAKLFDNDYSTKWGNGLTATDAEAAHGGAYFIIKTSRAICPTYCKLVTGTDNATWNHRNWSTWTLYAIAATDDASVTRDADGWVALDKKRGVTEDVLPDKDSYEVFLNLTESNTTAYQYFKVEINSIMSGGGYMQMTEFALGDAATLQLEKQSAKTSAEAAVSADAFAPMSLITSYYEAIDVLNGVEDIQNLAAVKKSLEDQAEQIQAAASQYANLTSANNKAQSAIQDNILDTEGAAYLTKYTADEAIAPCTEYPVGNYAYVKANRQITGDQAAAEATRINTYVQDHTNVAIEPINVTYTALSGSGGFNNEDNSKLIDGDSQSTKWCTNTLPAWMVFKASSPIKPSYYGLVTGGDTQSNPGRNWKNWKIYAGNFASDAEATRDADGWVLIDNKENIGSDVLKTANKYESYLDLSESVTTNYQYFRIEITAAASGSLIQMNELTFYNQGNFNEYRDEFVKEVEDALDDNDLDLNYDKIQSKLVEDFETEFTALKNATDAPSLMSLKNQLTDMIASLKTSKVAYESYLDAVASMKATDFSAYADMAAWKDAYLGTAAEAGVKFINGNYNYIMDNLTLSADEINTETAYINAITDAVDDAENAGYITLGGHTNSQWGDGYYGHIVDNDMTTKWGGEADASGNTYVIFRTIEPVAAAYYSLTTGGDTGSNPGRNWKKWEIYGANFAGDGAATKDADGWVLIDKKENIGQDRLDADNQIECDFGYSTNTTEKYTYYKIVVYEAYSGSAQQMQDFRFRTQEEFAQEREDLKDACEYFMPGETAEFKDQVVGDEYADKYQTLVAKVDGITNMEDLISLQGQLDQLAVKMLELAVTPEVTSSNINEGWMKWNMKVALENGEDSDIVDINDNTGKKVGEAEIKCVDDSVKITLPELSDGDYTLVLAEEVVRAAAIGKSNEAANFDFTVKGTGINGIIAADSKNGKFLKNGKVIIVKEGKTYNAAGARLK